jgi:hypothetical protein
MSTLSTPLKDTFRRRAFYYWRFGSLSLMALRTAAIHPFVDFTVYCSNILNLELNAF